MLAKIGIGTVCRCSFQGFASRFGQIREAHPLLRCLKWTCAGGSAVADSPDMTHPVLKHSTQCICQEHALKHQQGLELSIVSPLSSSTFLAQLCSCLICHALLHRCSSTACSRRSKPSRMLHMTRPQTAMPQHQKRRTGQSLACPKQSKSE